ncbi:MAG: epoxide hydrolase [Cytophagaceae bacterium]|nr:MAG: epoxide hydrolase [Cytophagaceae bacterium]
MQPFHISIPQPVLDDLHYRLAHTRWPDEITDSGWDYGTNREYLKQLTDYWQNSYDWRAQEAKLNQFPHFKAEAAGLNLHFIKLEGKGPNPLPLLLVHGWPDSFFRMLKILPLLTDPAAHGGRAEDAFTVIVPDLPGYGFSDKPREPGYDPKRMADVLAELMTKTLGYEKFVAHGGDWGSSIVEQLALHHAGALLGIHLTDVPSTHAKMADKLPDLSAAEQVFVAKNKAWQEQEAGYQKIQGTKPETLAFGLNDSPVGLLGWIIEKFHAWSDNDGNIEHTFTKDDLLTNVMIYWVTQSIGSSMRLYYETMHRPALSAPTHTKVPTGFAIFPQDITPAPREFAERFFNVQRWQAMPQGGHFAALEEPGLLVKELREFMRLVREKIR